MFNHHNKFKQGFSLVEVMIVASIIVLMSGIILASLNTARAKARDAKRIAEIEQLKTAIEIYSIDNQHTYPDGGQPSDVYADISALQAAVGANMPTLPVDPLGSAWHEYRYVSGNEDVTGKRHAYAINVLLEDGGMCKTGQNVHLAWFDYAPLCEF